MKPFINLDELSDFKELSKGKFGERYAAISEQIGAKDLSYSLTVVPPGKRVCPFHNHRVNEEMFLILEGEGTLRFGSEEYAIRRNDIIACPPGGQDVAHQIINTSDQDIKYLSLSTSKPYDICEYPDSGKILSYERSGEEKFNIVSRVDQRVDYWQGETD